MQWPRNTAAIPSEAKREDTVGAQDELRMNCSMFTLLHCRTLSRRARHWTGSPTAERSKAGHRGLGYKSVISSDDRQVLTLGIPLSSSQPLYPSF